MPDLLLKDKIKNKLSRDLIIKLRKDYLQYLNINPFPAIREKNYHAILKQIKRDTFTIGPYNGITFFEAANRIASDLTLIEGVIQLFDNNYLTLNAEVQLRLGTMQQKDKGDFSVFDKKKEIQGEAFNVAPSFFKNKLYKTLKKWSGRNELKYIVINEDCLEDSSCKTYYENHKTGKPEIIFIMVKSW